MPKRIVVRKEAAELLLETARATHPREMLMLLRGRGRGDDLRVDEVLFAPLSEHGEYSSSFRLDMLPLDFSIVGLAHSHPSGDPHPSDEDLTNFIGIVMLILTPPYLGVKDIHAYNWRGDMIQVVLEG